MPDREQVHAVFREWATKADSDLKTAAFVLKMRTGCPTDAVCFHAQQCVEKYLKAALVCEGVPFPKTHSIADLARLLPSRHQMLLPTDEQERLTTYATVTRYPGGYDPIPLSEARRAVVIARLVRREIRRAYPANIEGRRGGKGRKWEATS